MKLKYKEIQLLKVVAIKQGVDSKSEFLDWLRYMDFEIADYRAYEVWNEVD